MDQSAHLGWRSDGEPIHPKEEENSRRRCGGRGGGGREIMASAAGRGVGEEGEIELLALGM